MEWQVLELSLWKTCASVIIHGPLTYQLPLPPMQVGMFKIHPEIPEVLSAEARAFILSCFEPDPHKRVTAADLLKEGFLRQVNKGKKNRIAFKPSGETYLFSWGMP
jgi:serine/threonine protein kinase